MENSLGNIFNLQSIKLDLDGKTKEMIFTELVDRVVSVYPECSKTEILAEIKQREDKLTTGIGSGVAIPHAFCRGINNMAGAIGISQQGIDYGALDNKPVHVVFLLVISKKMEENHLRILNLISRLAQSEAISLMKNASSAEIIHEILSQVHFDHGARLVSSA